MKNLLIKKHGKRIQKLNIKQQVIFFELLADLLTAGFKLQTALIFITQIQKDKHNILKEITNKLSIGKSFSQSIKASFNDEIVWQIQLAEAHGSLEETIKLLAVSMHSKQEQNKKLKQLMQYPMLLIFLLIGVGFFIRYYFVDQLMNLQGKQVIHDTFGKDLLFKLIVGILFVIISLVIVYVKLPIEKRLSIYLKVPVLNKLIRYQMGYQIGYIFGLLLKAGQPYKVISLYLLKLPKKSIYHQIGLKLETACEQGIEIEIFFKSLPYIPGEFGLFFVRGKTNTQLGDDLLAFSKISFQNLLKTYERLLASVQPIMFIIVAVGIVSLYGSMLLPMYKMIGEIG